MATKLAPNRVSGRVGSLTGDREGGYRTAGLVIAEIGGNRDLQIVAGDLVTAGDKNRADRFGDAVIQDIGRPFGGALWRDHVEQVIAQLLADAVFRLGDADLGKLRRGRAWPVLPV